MRRRRLLLNCIKHYYQGDPFEFVDLGLPSGTLWMKFDLGISGDSKYYGYGGYGQIGSTEIYPVTVTRERNEYGNWEYTGKIDHQFSWETSVVNGYNSEMNEEAISKWISEHTTNNILNLDVDPIYVNSNGIARMPTKTEIQELLDYTNIAEEYGIAEKYGLIDDPLIHGGNMYTFTNKSDSSKFIFVGIGAKSYDSLIEYSSMTYGYPAIPSNEFNPSSSTHCLYGYNNNSLGDGGIISEVTLDCGFRFRGVKV